MLIDCGNEKVRDLIANRLISTTSANWNALLCYSRSDNSVAKSCRNCICVALRPFSNELYWFETFSPLQFVVVFGYLRGHLVLGVRRLCQPHQSHVVGSPAEL